MTPIVTSPRAVARVSAASFWKRVTGRHSTAAAAFGGSTAIPLTAHDRRRPTLDPAWPVCAAPCVVAAACADASAPSASPSGSRSAAPPRTRRRRPAWGGAGQPRPDAHARPRLELRSSAARRGSCSSSSTSQNQRGERPGPDGVGRVLRPRHGPEQAGRHRRRRVHLDDPGRARHVHRRTSTCPRPGSGAPNSRRPQAPPASPGETTRVTFEVHDDSPSVAVGEKAPASKTPTLADVGGDISKISTDTKPDPAFYQTSVADALAAHKPFVLIFATPKFCADRPVRPDARPLQAGRRGQPGRDLHQRRAVQAPGRRRPAPARPRRRTAGLQAPPT